jgi:hypothetical protein
LWDDSAAGSSRYLCAKCHSDPTDPFFARAVVVNLGSPTSGPSVYAIRSPLQVSPRFTIGNEVHDIQPRHAKRFRAEVTISTVTAEEVQGPRPPYPSLVPREGCAHERREPHTCPYKSEIEGDKTTLCTCCEACEENCELET